MEAKGKYWNGEPNAMLMRKEIAYLNQELDKERMRIALLGTIARRSQTGVTISYEIPYLDSDCDDASGGFCLMERRKSHPKRRTIGSAIDAANLDSLAQRRIIPDLPNTQIHA